MVSPLAAVGLLLLFGAAGITLVGISRSGKKRPNLRRHEHTQAFTHGPSDAKPQAAETAGTLAPVDATTGSFMATPGRPSAMSAEAILQFVLDALHHLTGLPLLMVNQPDHNLPCLTRASAIETQMRADQKNAELLDSPGRSSKAVDFPASWSDPEEEMNDLSSSEQECSEEEESDWEDGAEVAPVASTAQNQLFDGLQFYLAVSQVRERTVRSVVALGMAKALTTIRDRKQNESIAVIEQQYPDFTCLPTPTRSSAVRQLPRAEQPALDLLAALRLPSATAVAQSQSPLKVPVRARLTTVDEEGRVRLPSLPSHGHNLSRVA
jgi:hypothetical protein